MPKLPWTRSLRRGRRHSTMTGKPAQHTLSTTCTGCLPCAASLQSTCRNRHKHSPTRFLWKSAMCEMVDKALAGQCVTAERVFAMKGVQQRHTCAKKYKYAARENISKRKIGRKVIRLYFAVLMLFGAKPAVLSAGTPPAKLTVLESLTKAGFSSSSSVCR